MSCLIFLQVRNLEFVTEEREISEVPTNRNPQLDPFSKAIIIWGLLKFVDISSSCTDYGGVGSPLLTFQGQIEQ